MKVDEESRGKFYTNLLFSYFIILLLISLSNVGFITEYKTIVDKNKCILTFTLYTNKYLTILFIIVIIIYLILLTN